MNPRVPVLTVWDQGRLVGIVNPELFRRLIERSLPPPSPAQRAT